MDINKAVLEEFDKYQKFVEETGGSEKYNTDAAVPYMNGTLYEGQMLRLRMDYEMDGEVDGPPDNGLYDIMTADMLDVLENGDVDNISDPFLKVCNGWKKRGKKPVSVELASAIMYRDYKWRKDSTEFTVYILFLVKWED